jgi:hypothetical protein
MTTSTPLRNVSSARRGLAIYLVVVVVLSAPLQAFIILTQAFDDPARSVLWVSALMLVPTVASVVAG